MSWPEMARFGQADPPRADKLEQIGLYPYQDLGKDISEIRLADLLPGESGDDVHLRLRHSSLNYAVEGEVQDPRMPLDELQKTLQPSPEDWKVRKSLDNRYIFASDIVANRWTHPDVSIPASYYQLPHDYKQPEKPDFEALSYTWGPATNAESVFITDSSHQCPTVYRMVVRSRLAEALKYLRQPKSIRTLWIDSICINQGNMGERSSQVPRMHSIYSNAKRVVIWIGPESDDSSHGLEILTYLGAQTEFFTNGLRGDRPGAEHPKWYLSRTKLPFNNRDWKSIERLLRRPWFKRVWVLQEAVTNLNTVIQCGTKTAEWYSVRKALYFLNWKKTPLPAETSHFLAFYTQGLFPLGPNSYKQSLLWASNQSCTVPLDKVYGILSIFPCEMRSQIQVDYELSPQIIFQRLLKLEAAFVGRLTLLTHCTSTNSSDGWPSWVPNWDRPLHHLKFQSRPYYRWATGQSRSHVRFVDPYTLVATGKFCATLRTASRPWRGKISEIWEDLVKWLEESVRAYDTVIEQLAKALAEVLSLGRIKERFAQFHASYPTEAELFASLSRALISRSLQGNHADCLGTMVLDGEKIFLTHEGHIGSTTESIQEGKLNQVSALGYPHTNEKGDQIAIILGCDCPFILRRLSGPRPAAEYRLIGSCFTDGLMKAEGLLGPMPTQRRSSFGECHEQYRFMSRSLDGHRWEEDPRLPDLPSDWEIPNQDIAASDELGRTSLKFLNKRTGEVSQWDPRLDVAELRDRGVELTDIVIV